MSTPSYEDSLPSRELLQQWAAELAEAVEQERVEAAELVELLRLLRRLGRDSGWLADIVLLLAREKGAALPALATAWSRTGQSTYVHAPDTRLTKLSDRYGDAATVLEHYRALPSDAAEQE